MTTKPATAGEFVTCDVNAEIAPLYDHETFATTVQAWHNAFGGGGGKLNQGDGLDDTYQAVCCSGWCLYATNTAGTTYSWNDDDFNYAVGVLESNMQARSNCGVQLGSSKVGFDDYLTLNYANNGHTVIDATCDGISTHLVDAFGDTCGGAHGFNGPQC